MREAKTTIAILLLAGLGAGCGPKVMVPPEVDLSEYGSVGIISFTSNAKGNLDEYATQRFLEEIRDSQKQVQMLELGNQDEVLDAVHEEKMGPEAIKAIGKKYDVGAVIAGHLEVSDVKPSVDLSTIFTMATVQADVEATLSAKIFETERGSTVWLDSAHAKRPVAHVSVFSGGDFNFDADDPDEAYGKLVESLVQKVTRDLRVRWERR